MYLTFCSSSSEKCECMWAFAPHPSSPCECIAVRAFEVRGLRYIRTAPSSPCECIAVRAPRSSKTGCFFHVDLPRVARKFHEIVIRLISATAPLLTKRIHTRPPMGKHAPDAPPNDPPPKLPQSGQFKQWFVNGIGHFWEEASLRA